MRYGAGQDIVPGYIQRKGEKKGGGGFGQGYNGDGYFPAKGYGGKDSSKGGGWADPGYGPMAGGDFEKGFGKKGGGFGFDRGFHNQGWDGGMPAKGCKKGSRNPSAQTYEEIMSMPVSEKIWVGSLPHTTTPEKLSDHFSSFGPVRSVDLKTDRDGMPRGFAFVFFESADAAKEVINNRKDNMYEGQWIDCKPAVADEGKGKGKGKDIHMGADENTPVSEKLFVNNLPRDASEDAVVFHFCQFGNVTEAALKKDHTGVFRGFAFVTFSSIDEAQLVLDSPEAFSFDGTTLDIKPAQASKGKDFGGKGKGKGGGKGKIWVGCLPLHAGESHVREFFQSFGDIADVVLEYDPDGSSSGSAHVVFENADSMRSVLSHYGENGGHFNPLEFEPGILLDIKGSDIPEKGKGKGSDRPVSEKIFVGSLPSHLKQADVEEFYSQFGQIKEVYMKKDQDGSFRGHCYVTFRDVESAQAAIDAQQEGKRLGFCRPFAHQAAAPAHEAQPSAPPPTCNVLKIEGLPSDPKARDVFKYFYNFSVTRIRDTGDTIFIQFTSDAEALKAFTKKSGEKLGSSYCTLSGGTHEELAAAALIMKHASASQRDGAKGGKGGRSDPY